ncbi:MAG TPA: hypothetical protein VH413_01370 [Verrucomicrobiae bacterium]|nr:hypothetical protein [Verrucomicrobiae bacterium]
MSSRADVPISNPSGVCLNVVQWIGNGCYPWYGSVVSYNITHSPPCPGSSELEVVPCSGPVSVLGGPLNSGLPDGSTVTINPDGSATSSPPVSNGSQPVPNPGSAPILVGQTLNGQLTGNYVSVPPGSTGSLPVQGSPGDGNNWGIMPMPPGTSITSPDPGVPGPGGSINIGNGTPVFPPNSGIGYIPGGSGSSGGSIIPIIGGGGNSDYPFPEPIPDPPDWGSAPGAPAPAPVLTNGLPDIPPGYVVPTNINGGGTIGFPSTPTNSLGSNVEAGFSALAQQDSLDSQAIVKAIQAMDSANQTGHAGVSNAINRGDNILTGMSNHLGNIDNSTQQLTNQGNVTSNQLSQIISNTIPRTNGNYNPDDNTAAANGATAEGATMLQGLGDKFAIDPGTVGGSPGSFLFSVPGQGSWDINPLNGGQFPAVALAAPWVRALSQWAMTAWFLFWLVGEINQVVRDATHLPQGTSAEGAPVFGSASALIATGVVFVALTVLVTYISSLVVNSVVATFIAHPFGSGGGSAVQAGISLLDAVFDIGLCVSLMAQRLALSFYLSKAYFICAGVVRFAVG